MCLWWKNLNVPLVKRVSCRGFSFYAARIWNELPADIRSQEKPHQSVTVDEKRVGQFKAKIKKWIWDGGVPFKWHIAAHVPYKCNVIYKNVMIYICQNNICQNWINVEVWCWVPAACWLFFKYLITILTNKEMNDCRYLEKKCLGT